MTALSLIGIALLALVTMVAGALACPRAPVSLFARLWPDISFRGPTRPRAVSLTFDDGPDPVFTPQVLAILREQDVPATFFLSGERARAHPALVRAICEGGHEIANHSDSWRRTVGLALPRFEADLLAAESTLAAAACFVRFFRPSGIYVRQEQRAALARRGYRCVLGSVYALDPHGAPAALIAWLIRRALRPGAIIVLHDSGGDRTRAVRALPRVIEDARRRGLRLVRLSELLGPAPDPWRRRGYSSPLKS